MEVRALLVAQSLEVEDRVLDQHPCEPVPDPPHLSLLGRRVVVSIVGQILERAGADRAEGIA